MKKKGLFIIGLSVFFLTIIFQGCVKPKEHKGDLIIINKTIEDESGTIQEDYITFTVLINGNEIQPQSIIFTKEADPRVEYSFNESWYLISVHYPNERNDDIIQKVWVMEGQTTIVEVKKDNEGFLYLDPVQVPKN